GYIRYNAGKSHSRLHVFKLFHPVGEAYDFKLRPRITPWFGEFEQNVIKGWQTDVIADVLIQCNTLTYSLLTQQITDRALEITCHRLNDRVALWMYGTGIQWMLPVPDP